MTHQRGAAFLLLVVTLVLGAAAVFYSRVRSSTAEAEKDRATTSALQQAKAALIGNAVAVTLTATPASTVRPGDFPCPDTNDSGSAGASCNTQATRVGRLPWKTLGLPDLRDGDGERLWYAVSTNFKNNTRTLCTAGAPEATTCLNSDTRGTITIRDTAGQLVHDAFNTDPASSGVIAVVFSAGAVLQRQGAAAAQDRSCTVGVNCTAAGLCTGSPTTNTPKCNPVNYLDVVSGVDDNADFIDGNSANGFIKGIVRDASGNVIVNDRLMLVTYQDLMPQLEKRVTAEVSKCLVTYANANFRRYPWPAPVTTIATPFSGGINTVFGRVPDAPLWTSRFGNVTVAEPPASMSVLDTALATACTTTPGLCMNIIWPITGCVLPKDPTANSWWNNWKLQVFYSVADAYKPQFVYTQTSATTVSLGTIALPAGCPACLTVSPPSLAADKQIVVITASRTLAGQSRASPANRQSAANYLEGENNNSDTVFTKQSGSTTFNDMVFYK